MFWPWFEWINRIGAVLQFVLSLGVGLVAIVVAIQLTRRRLCREAAWVLALGWLASCALTLAHGVVDLLLMPALGWTVGQWLGYGIDLLDMACFGIMAAGLFMFRPGAGGGK